MTSAISFYLGRRGVSRSGGNCISAAAAPFFIRFAEMWNAKCGMRNSPAACGRFITAAASLVFVGAAVSLFGCHPVAAHRTDGTNGTDGLNARIDFLTPNPDIAPLQSPEAGDRKSANAAALKAALNL